jgi:hypothetical protein
MPYYTWDRHLTKISGRCNLGVIAHTIEGDYASAISFYKRCLEVSSSPSVICAIDDGRAMLDSTNVRVLLCLCASRLGRTLTLCHIFLHSLVFLPDA